MSGLVGNVCGPFGADRSALEGLWAAALGAAPVDGAVVAFTPAAAQPLLHQAVTDAVQVALGRLQREAGLPGFAADALRTQLEADTTAWQGARSAALSAGDPAAVSASSAASAASAASDASAAEAAEAACGDAIRAFGHELADAIVHSVRGQIQADGEGSAAGGATKASGGSWMQAIARAMGQVLGNKASRMVELSQKIQDLSDRSRTAVGDGASPLDDAGRAQQLQDAAESQRLNTEFQATGQEFNLLQTTFSTAMKTLGEGMASIARRQ